MHVGGRAMAANYTPANHPVNAFKAAVQMAAREAYRGPVIDAPLAVRVIAVFPRPKGMVWKSKPMPRLLKVSKPDVDNCIKSLLDALNGILFRDDAQVCQLRIEKWIAAGDEQPHVEVVIEGLSPCVVPVSE
jgi:Holliday junction resolvase RusA-like endonuclease